LKVLIGTNLDLKEVKECEYGRRKIVSFS
jgi:hypothetical protein